MRSSRLLLVSTALTALSPCVAYAQDAQSSAAAVEQASTGEDTIVITGSRIARPDLETASPVTVISQDEISLRQAETAEDLLRDLPSLRPANGPAVNNGGNGSANLDLRGMGTQRTLVLLDGRRIVPYNLNAVVDLNNIPVNLVQRVDTVTGGASSVYGADAVSGVVNFITKRDFAGLDVSGSYRITGKGDADQYRVDILTGANFEDGRGNVVLGLGYQKREPLYVTDRDIARFPISSANGQFSGSQASVPALLTSISNEAMGLPKGDYGAVIDPATGAFRAATQNDLYNSNLGTYFQTPLERYNVYAAGRYEITEGIEFYSTGLFAVNKTNIDLASSATFTNTYQLPLNNAYLPAPARNQICRGRGISQAACDAAAAATTPTSAGYLTVPVILQRRFTEYGPRGGDYDTRMFQVQTGLRGDITETLSYDVSAQYGESSTNQSRENWGSFSKLQQALRSYRNAAGTPVCTDTTNGCVPINLFGPEGSITPEMLAFIDLDARIRTLIKQSVVTGNVSGDLFGLASPWAEGTVAFSLGAEYRKIQAESLPDGPSQIQGEVLGTGARTPPDVGKYDVKEVFGELIIPLIEDKPFFNNLSIETGLRYSDYSTTGSSTTWKAGGNYEPVKGFKFRGMYQRAVRSPNILELYQSPVQALSNLAVDPCAGATPTAPRALCEATGAPAGTYGSIPQPSSSQINVTTSGNRDLDVEKASTYTLGAVFTPSFTPGLAVTLDYFNIKIKDAITNPSQGDILNGCYQTALNPAQTPNAFCALIKRNPLNGSLNGSGETPGVILASSNLGVIETAGLDLGVSYRFDLVDVGIGDGDSGTVRLAFNGTWLDYYHFQANPNSINRDCTGYYSTNCTNPRPEWRWNARATYSVGIFDASLLWNHISSVRLEPQAPSPRPELSTPQPGGPNPSTVLESFREIGAYDTFDFALRASINNVDLTLTVDNIFDKNPPLVGANVGGTQFNNGNTFPTIYDVLGRTFTLGARVKF